MEIKTFPLIHAYRPNAPIMFGHGGYVSQTDFVVRVVRLSQMLPDTPYLINLCKDRYAFALVFCAALVRGVVNILPPNRHPKTLEEVAIDYPDCCAVVDDDEAPSGMSVMDFRVQALDIDLLDGTPIPDLPRLDGEQLAAIAFTSGTTGKSLPIRKLWRTFVGTARALAVRLVPPGKRPVIVATVPSQHMYGLEMTVMMALHGGCVMDSRHPFYPDDVESILTSFGAFSLLVTTPVHLRALIGANVKMPALMKVISATAPLAREVAAEVEQLCQAPVEEVFGCTEAGSIATRRTLKENIWTMLDGMSLEVSEGLNGGAVLVHGRQLPDIPKVEDRLVLVNQYQFQYLGRPQDMANIAGKRASLSDITLKLLAIDGVDDGIVFMPDEVVGRNDRRLSRPAALIVSELPLHVVRAALSKKVDSVFLPRPIKKVAALPRNDTGKLLHSMLHDLWESCR